MREPKAQRRGGRRGECREKTVEVVLEKLLCQLSFPESCETLEVLTCIIPSDLPFPSFLSAAGGSLPSGYQWLCSILNINMLTSPLPNCILVPIDQRSVVKDQSVLIYYANEFQRSGRANTRPTQHWYQFAFVSYHYKRSQILQVHFEKERMLRLAKSVSSEIRNASIFRNSARVLECFLPHIIMAQSEYLKSCCRVDNLWPQL